MKNYIKETISLESGSAVTLKGWINTYRRMGKIAFIDLRDSTGLVQIVCVPDEMTESSRELLDNVRPEFVVKITGVIQARGEKQKRADQPTGQIEILAKDLEVITEAKTPPFEIDNEERQANEELRLKYRYLDLRHQRLNHNIRKRHEVMQFLRQYLTKKDFVEVQTPILSKSTPEGARDYLVPSRLHPGKFFALPQAPQQYKQLLMVAGLERYFQIAPCFRDEDARADRSPGEFYQLDMEMSFVTQEEILALVEEMFTQMVAQIWPEKKMTQTPWPRLNYDDVMRQYNSDKPDLRQNKNDPNELAFAWIVNFPLFKKQTAEDTFHYAGKTWGPSHNMFTAPREEHIPLLDTNPGEVKSYQHDLVLNGFEVGGGAVRIHDSKLQEKIWDLIGFTAEQKQQFKHYLEAFSYGVPPHGGIAPGLDRLLMVLLGEKSLKEAVAFPLTSDGRDPMMESPSEVAKEQLDELNLMIKS